MCLGMYTFLASHLYSVKTLPYQLKEKKRKKKKKSNKQDFPNM